MLENRKTEIGKFKNEYYLSNCQMPKCLGKVPTTNKLGTEVSFPVIQTVICIDFPENNEI